MQIILLFNSGIYSLLFPVPLLDIIIIVILVTSALASDGYLAPQVRYYIVVLLDRSLFGHALVGGLCRSVPDYSSYGQIV